MDKKTAKKYFKDLLQVDDGTAEKLANEYVELKRKEKET